MINLFAACIILGNSTACGTSEKNCTSDSARDSVVEEARDSMDENGQSDNQEVKYLDMDNRGETDIKIENNKIVDY